MDGFVSIIIAIVGGIISGFASFYVSKKLDINKRKVEGSLQLKDKLFMPLQKCMNLSDIRKSDIAQITEDVNRLSAIICNEDNYFLIPPDIVSATKELQHTVCLLGTELGPKPLKFIRKKYEKLRLMLLRLEDDVRIDLGHPRSTVYETIKYYFGTPKLIIFSVLMFACTFSFFITYVEIKFGEVFAAMCMIGFFVVVILAFIIIGVVRKKKEKSLFKPQKQKWHKKSGKNNSMFNCAYFKFKKE